LIKDAWFVLVGYLKLGKCEAAKFFERGVSKVWFWE